jgi:selenide, water dikinase
MGPEALAQVLRPLTQYSLPGLLIGLQTGDDAAVYQLNSEQALVQTVDFFPPVVDDPYAYGAIAAANAMSDVYAMGGEVLMALAVAAFPDDLPLDVVRAVFEGAAAKVAEAGGAIVGGHTLTDREPKYGLSVTGMVHPQKMFTKGGARVGDALLLTKAIGAGVITTALKGGQSQPEYVEAATTSMLSLNRLAAQLLSRAGVKGCTDVTGFGLLGHAWEMASASQVGMRISLSQVPLLPGSLDYAAAWIWPGGMWRNRQYLAPENDPAPHVQVAPGLADEHANLLFDPETSGGLLAAVPPDHLDSLLRAFVEAGQPFWVIGEVVVGDFIAVTP